MAAPTITRPVAITRPRVRRRRIRPWRFAARAVVALLVLAMLAVGWSALRVWSQAQVHDRSKTDAIVVLGAAQFDGTPSPVLRARLSHALELWRAGVAPVVVTVGGRQPSDRFTEGGSGRQWLVRQGVPADAVMAITEGTDTVSSLTSVALFASTRGLDSVTLVSDPAHMARSQAIASRLGFEARVNSTTDGDGSTLTGSYLARETAGYMAFEFLGRWGLAPEAEGSSDAR